MSADTGNHVDTDRTGNEIAVIGMSGRFPGAETCEKLWENLANGVECITFFSDRELAEAGIEERFLQDPHYVKGQAILDGIQYFDASFFGYIPAEAEVMDPQIRIFHQCAWEALEDSGYDPDRYPGFIGLYAGASSSFNWQALALLKSAGGKLEQFSVAQLRDKDFMTTHISYKLNLKGPSFTLSTACSTSLTAVVVACQGLLIGECDMALAGGVTIAVPQVQGYTYREGLVSSPDGHCRTFDARAAGTVSGSGAGVVVLKMLEEALAEGDQVYAVIKGVALNNDGIRKAGYNAPSIDGQAEAINAALEMAELNPESISYVETHGTGTPLGDPVEIEALKSVFHTGKKRYCAIGSIKTNMGHLDNAAGIAGFIKSVLVLKHRLIPPSLHFETPNPQVDFENSPFYVNTTLTHWQPRCDDDGNVYPLRAGVSSFGIGGTNAHVVLEEAPVFRRQKTEDRGQSQGRGGVSPPGQLREYQLILLSAKTQFALQKMTENLTEFFKKNLLNPNNHGNPTNPGLTLANAAYTLKLGRKAFNHRQTVVASTVEATIAALLSPGSVHAQRFHLREGGQDPHLIFMFPGLGPQYVNMGRELYQTEAIFRREMDRCFQILKPLLGYDLKETLYPGDPVNSPPERGDPGEREGSNPAASTNNIHQIEIAQIVIFIIEYSLAVLLMKWGMKPHAMIGYSVGEYAAACLSGVFSLQDALRLIVVRGKLVKKTAPGVMLSVPLPREQLNPIINNHLSLAIDNGPSSIIAGSTAAVEAFENRMKKKKIICMRLPGQDAHAPHSRLMDPILQEFQEVVAGIKRNEPQIPYISNVTGNWITASEAMSSTYWVNHLKETVRFARGMRELIKDKTAIFMEVGPGRDLSMLATRYLQNDSSQQVVSLIPHSRQKTEEYYFLLKRVGRLWLYGAPIDWKAFHEREKEKRYRVSLPTYPFEHQCYPVEGNPIRMARDLLPAGLPPARKPDIKDWFYVPLWQQFPRPDIDPAEPPGHWHWLIFIDDNDLGERLVKVLKEMGQHVVIVKKGSRFCRVSDEEFNLCVSRPGDYDSLFIELGQGKQVPRKLLHLWNVTGKNHKGPTLEEIDGDLDLGLFSLLNIARAVGRQSITSDIDIHAVSDHMQKVTGEEVLCPQKAALLGAVKIIPLEYTNITCHSIDIVYPAPGSQEEDQLLNALLSGFLSADSPLVAAYRGAHLWVPVFKPYPIRQSKEKTIKPLRQNGVYLVTGGLGGMGLTLAHYLAKQVNARLILTGRSRFPDRDQWDQWLNTHDNDDKISVKIKKVRDMETSGAEVMIFSADAADLQQMKRVIDRAQERFGPINGVLHTAGLADYEGVIQRRTREMTESILAPKIKGTLVLDQLLKNTTLDFFILFSSVGNILYKVKFGQVGYNAANEFLDAYASYNGTANKRFTMTINWTDWLEVGMAVEAVEKARREGNPGASVHHEVAVYPHEGIEVFCRALGTRRNQVVISTQELDNVIKQVDKAYGNNMHDARPHIHVSPLQQQDRPAPGKLRPRPHLDVTYLAPTNETHLELARIWQDFFGIQRIGINDDFFDLGGDSLKAMTIANIIHKQMGANIPLAEFFSSPTVKKLSQFISVSREEEYLSIRAAETREYYGLSSAQKRLYFLQQMEESSTVYNEPLVVVLEGGLDRQKLEHTFRRLIRRWENFRTSFREVNEEPVQEIQGEVEFAIEELAAPPDNMNHQEGKESEEKKIIKNFIRPFNLSRAPLLRVGLIKKEERKHVLIVDTHHIVTDGISNNIFIGEMIGVYAGKDLPPPALQYKDYAWWLNQPRQQAALEKQAGYWLRQFPGNIPLLNLPTDYVRPEVQSFEGDIAAFGIGKEETRQLKALAAEEDVTVYMLLLAIYYVFLSKMSGQEEVVLGTNVAGRRHLDLQSIIGVFVNTLALRNDPGWDKPFHHFLKEVKKNTLEAFENQDYQFEDLVNQVAVNRDLSRNPLFDVFFSFIELETDMNQNPAPEKLKLEIALYPYENKTAKFDLTLNAGGREDTLFFSFEYCTKLFKKETIRRFTRYFKKILLDIIKEPHKNIWEIQIISTEEKRQILFDFNDTKTTIARDKDYPRLFEEQVRRTPDKISARYHNRQISYGELNRETSRIAHYLSTHGVTVGSTTAVYLKRSIDMLAAIIGIFKAGGVYLPLEVDYPPDRTAYMLEDSEAGMVITAEEYEHSLSPGGYHSLYLHPGKGIKGSGENFGKPGNQALPATEPHDLVYIIYTSGTTGRPKGVMIHQLGMLNHLYAKINELSVTGEDIIAQTASPCFDISIWQFLAALLVGGRTFIIDKEIILEPRSFLQVLQQGRVTILESVPSLMTSFLEETRESGKNKCLNYLRWMVPTGEPLGVPLVREWYRQYPGIRLVNAYGPTEASDDVTHYVVNNLPSETQTSIPIGKPLQNLHIYILDKHLSLCPPGIRGEICVAGLGIGKGYWKDKEKTDRVFIPNPFLREIRDEDYAVMYRTGDIGYFREDGSIECLGRLDDQVKIRGNRIQLGEIESRLLTHDGIKEAVVMAREEKPGDKALCAYIVSGESSGFDPSELKAYLRKQLPDYMLPTYFVGLERLPLTPSGKIDRKMLPEPEPKAEGVGGPAYIAPRNDIEKAIAGIWSEVLGVEKDTIGIDSNFFELGGQSLKAIRLVSHLYKKLNIKLALVEIFKTPTIRGLAESIAGVRADRFVSITPDEKKEYYPLSSAQKRLYFLQQVDEGGTAYNIPTVVTLEGIIDGKKLEASFTGLIKRHESLRTSFLIINDEPVQRVHDEVEFEIEYYNKEEVEVNVKVEEKEGTRGLAPLPVESAAPGPQPAAALINSFIRPFDLSRTPLLRVGLIKPLHTPTSLRGCPAQEGKEDKHLLMVDMHHIITDGISQEILVREFMAFYAGKKPSPLKFQYKDFVRWCNSETERGIRLKQEEYWKQQFQEEIPVLDLPTDYVRPPVQRFEGSNITFEIGSELTSALKTLALQEGATLFMVLLSIYNILLSKLSGQEDIVIGTPLTGRRHVDLEGVIGMFVNTLALRNYPHGSGSFKEFLNEVRERALEAFENQDYPFEELVGQLPVNRDTGRNPLFDVVFVLDATEDKAEEKMPGLRLTPYSYERSVSKFDITLSAFDTGEKLAAAIQYCTKLFSRETIGRFKDYLVTIALSVAENPGKRISAIEIISPHEKKRILVELNDSAVGYPREKTIHELFTGQVQETPDHTALIGIGRNPKFEIRGSKQEETRVPAPLSDLASITYSELNERSIQLAYLLIEKGVRSDTIVGIMLERSIEMIIGILGILKAGGAYLPIDPEYPEERINYILADSGISILVTSPVLSEKFEKSLTGNCQSLMVNEMPSYRRRLYNPPKEANSINNYQLTINNLQLKSTNLAYIIYTSGTTGKPKGAMIEHRNLVRLLFNDKFQFDFNDNDVWTLFHSFCFDFSVWEMYGALLYGGKLIVISRMSARAPSLYLEILKKGKVTVLNQTPSAFYHLITEELKYQESELKLRCVIFGGEALNPARLKKWREKYPQVHLINMYGITETTVHVTHKEIKDKEIASARSMIGKPIPTLSALVMDKDLHLLPPGVAGELCVGGKGVARGYLNRPALTKEKFIKNPYKPKELLYRSGDRVRMVDMTGELEYLGRTDHQVKIRGFRIEPGEIESFLLEHNHIKEAVVLARETTPAAHPLKDNPTADTHLCAYLVVDGELGLSQLREYLSQQLPDYMIPSTFVKLEKIPLTPNGKVDRKALDANGKRLHLSVAYTAPRNEMEKKIAGVWKEVLHVDRVGTHDNYFEMGGTSLDIIKINRKLEEIFQIKVPVVAMFMYTTVHSLANFLLEEADELHDRSAKLKRGKRDKMQQLQKRKGSRNE